MYVHNVYIWCDLGLFIVFFSLEVILFTSLLFPPSVAAHFLLLSSGYLESSRLPVSHFRTALRDGRLDVCAIDIDSPADVVAKSML